MAKIALSDLTGKAVELPPAPLRVLVFATVDELGLLRGVAEEQRNSSYPVDLVLVFIGTDLKDAKAFQKSNPQVKLYKANNIASFHHLGVTEVPWVVFVENSEIKLTARPNEIGSPLMGKLISRILPTSPLLQSAINKATEIPTDKVDQLEVFVEMNQKELDSLKTELQQRDDLISHLTEKL